MQASTKKYDLNREKYDLSDNVRGMARSGLPQLISKALASGLSFRDIHKNSGRKVSLGQLNSWHKGTSANMTVETVVALAKGLGESPTVVFEAVVGRSPNVLRDDSLKQILEDFTTLSARDHDELEVLIDCLKHQVQKRLRR